jgi:hypothetical protein
VDAHNGGVESQIEPWRVCRPVVAYSKFFDVEQGPDPYKCEKSDPDPHLSDADPQPCFYLHCNSLCTAIAVIGTVGTGTIGYCI